MNTKKMAFINDKVIQSRDILIVDDELPNLQLLTQLLSEAGYKVRPEEKPQLTFDSALAKPPALILLDVRMPEMDGFEVCKRLKQDERTRGIPIIFISALQDVQDKVLGFKAGGVDFITKPFQEEEVLARVRTHMELRNMQLHLEEMIAKRSAEVIEREERFRATFEQAAVGVAHVSTDGRFLRLNQKFCEIVGYPEDELLAMSFQDITHPDDLDSDLEYVRQVLNRDIETYSLDKRYYRKDGSIVWINLTVSLLFDKEGDPKYFVSVIKDISERKQTDKSLRQSHDFLEHLTSAVPDAIISIKMPERTINWANDSFNVLGYEPEEYVGQSVKQYYANPEDYYAVGDFQKDAIRKGDDIISTEVMALRKDGRVIPVELTATFYKEEGKISLITAMVRDISERKQAEEALRESETKYRSLIDNSIVGVFTTTFDGRFTFVNDAMARIFDFDSTELMLKKGALELWQDPKDRERMLAKLQKHGSVTNFEVKSITHADRHIHVLLSAKQIGDNILGMVMDISDRKQAEIKLNDAYAKINQLQKQLQAESAYLQEEIKLEHNFENIIGNSNAIQYTLFKVEQVAETDANVLILGETGTGKELIARAIHHHSQRKNRPLIKINCATLPANLIESELFGHEKGSFTSAGAKHKGRFEVANGSSLFLDEIGEMPIEAQAKLLRVIEDGEFERLGSTKTRKVDVRIIAATNRNLEKDVNEGKFRRDLWYRLNVFPITLPPLRDRIEDIPLIVQYYMKILARKLGKDIVSIPEKTMKTLQNYTWPGNVRELQNVLERAVIGTSGPKLQLSEALCQSNEKQPERLKSLHDMERDYIISILDKTNWKVSGKNSAAQILELDRSTLRARMKKLGIYKNPT